MNHAESTRTSLTLLQRLRDPNDTAAWEEFVKRYGVKISGWCRRQGAQPADAEDVTQEVLVRLSKRLPTFQYDAQRGGFRAWLKRVTINEWIDFVNSKRRHAPGMGGDAHLEWLGKVPDDDLARQLKDEFDLELLDLAKSRVQLEVSSRDWEIFRRLVAEDRPVAEVAQEFDMKITAVYMARSRVQKQLKEWIRRLEGSNSDSSSRDS